MRINDLTEENINQLKDGTYIIFDDEEVDYIVYFKLKDWNDKPRFSYDAEYSETFEAFKKLNKDCEMFPIESIKKPKEKLCNGESL